MLKVIMLIVVFFITSAFKVDVIMPHKTVKVHVFLITLCGTKVAYIYNHRGRTKIVSVNGMTVKAARKAYKYIMKYPVKNKVRALPGTNLPCYDNDRDISI